MARDIRVRVGKVIQDQSPLDSMGLADSAVRTMAYARTWDEPMGLADNILAQLTTTQVTNSTLDVWPTLTTHPYAVWNRSGNTLTSSARRNLPAYDSTDGFILGTTKPTWANSGCRIAQSQLTTNTTTNLITTADGQVIEGLYLPNGRIEVRHKNVTIRDCIIGIGWDSARGMINGNNAVCCNPAYDTTGWRLEYVTVDPQNAAGGDSYGGTVYQYNTTDGGASWQWSSFVSTPGGPNDSAVGGFYMIGEGFAWRCAVRNVTDAFMPDNQFSRSTPTGSSHIWGCYAQTRWMSHDYDPSIGDGTHNDGIQFTGNDGNTAIGNSFVCPPGNTLESNTGFRTKGQCIVITPYHSAKGTDGLQQSAQESGTVVYKNWLSGSYSQIAMWCANWQGGPAQPNAQIIGNRHGGTCVWMILISKSTNTVKQALSGNVVDTGGITWNNGFTAAGAAANVNTDAVYNELAAGTTINVSHAGNDRIVEPGTRQYLFGKGLGATTTSWIKTGTWTRVSASGPVPVAQTTVDGYSYAYVDIPPGNPGAVATTYQYQATGLSDTDTMVLTAAPDQSVSVPSISVAGVVQSVAYGASTSVTRTTTAGRTLVATVGHQSRTASQVTISDTAGNVWTLVGASENAGSTSEGRDSIWMCTGAASVTSVTATQSGASTVVALTLYELVNAAGGLRAASVGSTGTAPVETQVAAQAGDFVVGIAGRWNTAPTTTTTGYTQQTPLNVSTTYYTSAHTIAAATGSTGPTWVGSSSTTGMVTAAFIPG